MNTLQERLGVAVESDAARYSGADFVAARGASIAGRVRRRRTARAAGYGGGAMLAVGVLAVGGAKMPWGVFGAGLDVGASDCVTASVQASSTNGPMPQSLEGIDTYSLTTNDGTRTVEIAVVDGTPQIIDESATQVEERADGGFVLTLANGTVFDLTLVFDGDELESLAYNQRQPGGDAAGSGEMRVVPLSTVTTANVPSETGGSVVTFTQVSTGEELTAYVNGPGVSIDETGDGPPFFTFHEDDGTYSLDFTDGTRVFFTADGETATLVRVEAPAPTVSPSPSADCLTPEPSPSAVVEPEPSWGGELEAAPGEVSSPFQCGFVFPASVGSTGVITMGEPRWLTTASAEAAVQSLAGDRFTFVLSGDDVPMLQFSSISTWPGMNLGGQVLMADPTEGQGAPILEADGETIYGGFIDGAQFVLEAEDVVIATYVLDEAADTARTQFLDSMADGDGTLYGLDLGSGFTACPGVDPTALDGAQAVAVAGTMSYDEVGTLTGPYYAWQYITRG